MIVTTRARLGGRKHLWKLLGLPAAAVWRAHRSSFRSGVWHSSTYILFG